MYVQKLNNGKFQAVRTYKDPLTGKTRKATCVMEKDTARQRNAAERKLAAKIADIEKRAGFDRSGMTFGELVTKYIEGIRKTHRLSTVNRNQFALGTWLDLIGRDTLVSRLPYLDLLGLLDGTGKDAKWKNGKIKRLKACINWGLEHRCIDSKDFLARVTAYKQPPHREEIAEKFLEISEYHELVRETQDFPVYNLFIQMMVLSGMRFGEAAALHKEDVDLEGGVIHVRRSYDSQNRRETEVKNQTSRRKIFIQPQLADILRQMQRQMSLVQIQTRTPSIYFTRDEDGGPIHYFSFNKFLKRHSDSVCGRRLTTHALRHTAASVMFAMGFDLDEVARRLGHDGSRITRAIYVHMLKEVEEADRKKIGTLVV